MWTDEQKHKIVSEARIAGVKDTSKKHSLNPMLIYRWQNKEKKQPSQQPTAAPKGNYVPIYVEEALLREIITKAVEAKLKS